MMMILHQAMMLNNAKQLGAEAREQTVANTVIKWHLVIAE
jgi:hypothetical protein